MSAMPRVLLVTHRSVAGGAQRALAALARRLPEHGWAPTAALSEPGPLEDWLRAAGVPVRHGSAVAAARASEVDAVIGLCAEGHRLAGPAARELGLPAVWWQMLTPRDRPYERAAAAIPAAAVVCLTAAAAARSGVATDVIPLGIDVAATAARRGSGRALRARLAPSGPLIGIVGRLDPAKGQDDFLRAAARLDPDARFAIVGGAIVGHEGDLEQELRDLAGALGIADRVTFAGHVDDPLPWIDALDVMVVASHHEAFGLVCVEALALGVPVVATATDGPASILGDGRLVPVRAPDALADAVRQALAAPGGDTLKRARAFDEALVARRMAAVLRRVSGAPSAGGGSAAAPAVPAASA